MQDDGIGRTLENGKCCKEEHVQCNRIDGRGTLQARTMHGRKKYWEQRMFEGHNAIGPAGYIQHGVAGVLREVSRGAGGGTCSNFNGIIKIKLN